jgi:transcriptional regulator GlxA family with amidase domain
MTNFDSLSVGVLVYMYQAIDTIGLIDLIGSGSKGMASFMAEYGPIDEAAIANAPEVAFHHIGLTRDPSPLSAGVSIVPTCTVDDAPELDILILGGTDPVNFQPDPKYVELIRRHVAAGKLLFTNCTGAAVAAYAGVLDGKNATINHSVIKRMEKLYPKVKWTMDTKWVVDGNIWTAGGAVAGMDMVAHWMKQTYGTEVLTVGTMALDFEPRDVNGVLNVIPQRFDASGKQIHSHVFRFHD